MTKKRIVLHSIIAFLSGGLGLIGLSGWCCTIAGATILSFLGVASFSTFLVYNNKWFLLGSVIFFGLAIFYYFQYKNDKNCKIKK